MGFRLREVLENFFTVDDLNMVQLTQKMQKIKKKVREKKRQKCIDITLCKWSWQVGKKNILTPPQANR